MFLVNLCKGQVCLLSRDVNGCRVIQRILERFDHSEIDFILEEVFRGL
jgi:hypothetical protein